MGKILSITLVVYYLIGLIVLPNGNFAAMQDLPEMYSHCKSVKDQDMTVGDFFTDHVLNIDGVFDKHDHGDEQKPHEPLQNQEQVTNFLYCLFSHTFSLNQFFFDKETPASLVSNFIPSEYITKLFRPPIC